MLNRDFIAEASEKKNNPAFVKVRLDFHIHMVHQKDGLLFWNKCN